MKQFEHILYVVEEPVAGQVAAIRRAITLAGNNQARLTLLYAVEHPHLGPFAARFSPGEVEDRLRREVLGQLEAVLQPHRADVPVTTEVRFGTPFIEVIHAVLRNGHDLVIKASGYGGTHDFLFGGTDQHLLRKCPCPVWILHHETSAKYGRILAAVDFDPWREDEEEHGLNEHILGLASSLALSEFAELHIVHAWEPVTENMIRVFGSELSEEQVAANVDRERREHLDRLESLGNRLRGLIGPEAHAYVAPHLHLRRGNPRRLIPEIATELHADLIVMGTVSRTGVPGFLIGNTAEVVLNNIECSVLAVKPAGFVSPIRLPDKPGDDAA